MVRCKAEGGLARGAYWIVREHARTTDNAADGRSWTGSGASRGVVPPPSLHERLEYLVCQRAVDARTQSHLHRAQSTVGVPPDVHGRRPRHPEGFGGLHGDGLDRGLILPALGSAGGGSAVGPVA